MGGALAERAHQIVGKHAVEVLAIETDIAHTNMVFDGVFVWVVKFFSNTVGKF